MAWNVELDDTAKRQLAKLAKQDKITAQRIVNKLRDLARSDAPESMCKPLTGRLVGLHRLRVGDWRVIVDFHHDTYTVLALHLGHRKNIYHQQK